MHIHIYKKDIIFLNDNVINHFLAQSTKCTIVPSHSVPDLIACSNNELEVSYYTEMHNNIESEFFHEYENVHENNEEEDDCENDNDEEESTVKIESTVKDDTDNDTDSEEDRIFRKPLDLLESSKKNRKGERCKKLHHDGYFYLIDRNYTTTDNILRIEWRCE
jgi:hypothetical protein